MPFEPLRTDEKLEKPVKRERDMDTQMLFGCSSFVAVSLTTYGLVVWPFFAWMAVETIPRLALCLGVGLGPAFVLGIIAARRFGLAGGFGFLGGVVASAIFLYLRLQSAVLAGIADQAPTPEWPPVFEWMVPGLAMLLGAIVMIASIPKSEFPET